jgi:hypothetical protein
LNTMQFGIEVIDEKLRAVRPMASQEASEQKVREVTQP